MKTIKIQEGTAWTLKSMITNVYENAGIKMKTYDDVIIFLYQAFLALIPGSQEEKEFIEKAREYYNDKSKK